jgi:membrane associated rhomboid family serine protease
MSTMQPTVAPLTKTVKALVIANVSIWVVGVLILQNMFFKSPVLFNTLGLVPEHFLFDFYFWQPLTYMFLHSNSVFHVLFNMLILWWFGAELELKWGSRFFLAYYLVSGVGAALIYVACVALYSLISADPLPLLAPVVGASGACYGLLLAYGILFGERVIYFMMMFPMKAKYFVLIIGLVELVTLLNSGFSSGVANLAHLGGIVAGFLMLKYWTDWKQNQRRKKSPAARGRKLKLVVDNERDDKKTGPRYWN